MVMAAAGIGTSGPVAHAAVPTTAAYRPVTPCRLLDTRHGGGRPTTSSTLVGAGRCGVGDTATAVVVTITVPAAGAAGFVTAFPAGTPRPATSNLNVAAGATVANTALVALGASGAITLESNVALHLVVDVVGWFEPAATARAGRYVPTAPTRLLDTRAAGARPGAGAVAVAPVVGAPADAVAVAVNLTFTDTAGPGFFTAYGAGDRPLASTGNADAAGQTRAVFTLVPAADTVRVFTQSGAHVVVDLVGYVTGPSADEGTDGLLDVDAPRRVLDTRATGRPLAAGATTGVPSPAAGAAVWATVTTVDAPAAGFLTAWAAGTARPATSTVNASAPRQIVANAAVVQLSDRGLAVFAHPGGHVVVDVAGVFLGPALDTGPDPVDEVIGTSVGGRPIVATHRLDHPDAPIKVLVLGSMHGEEQAGALVVDALRLGDVPPTVDLWLMTTMNPDGVATSTRGNGRGVDLNRNFDGGSFAWCPTPGCGDGAGPADTGAGPRSEPETQAMWAFLLRERFDLVVSYHQPLDTVDCSPTRGPALLAACSAYAAASGITLNRLGFIDLSGTMTDSYMTAAPGRLAFTVELPAAGAGDVERHVAAVWAAAAAPR